MHLLAKDQNGSSNPLGISGNTDRIPFHPYFTFKDLVTIFGFLLALSVIVFYAPNLMGHSDNYIPANPMSTPASIEKLLKLHLSDESYAFIPSTIIANCLRPLSSTNPKTGIVMTKNGPVSMTKRELLSLLEGVELPKDPENFRSIANGMQQAEGYWGGEFTSLSSVRFSPKWSISQNASDSSILFFKTLKGAIDKDNKLKYSFKLTSSGNWHITMLRRDRSYIINVLVPYFNQLRRRKYTGMIKLVKILELLANKPVSIQNAALIVHLAYTITSSGSRLISLKEKLARVTGVPVEQVVLPELPIISMNTTPLNWRWIWGFFIGDGYATLRLRLVPNVLTGIPSVQTIPLFQMIQLNTPLNMDLAQEILALITSCEISRYIDDCFPNLVINVEGKERCTKLFQHLLPAIGPLGFLWKAEQMKLIINRVYVLNYNIRHWADLNIYLIELAYAIQHARTQPLDYWIQIIKKMERLRFPAEKNSYYFLAPFKGKTLQDKNIVVGWVVTLPKTLKVKPAAKYFFFKKHGGPDNTLKQALQYRDKVLNTWLEDLKEQQQNNF